MGSLFQVQPRRCRKCESHGIEGSLLKHFPRLEPADELKWGVLFRCQECGQNWYQRHDKSWFDRVDDLERLLRWNRAVLRLSDEVTQALASIGGVWYDQAIIIPCQVAEEPRAEVRVTRQPPLRASSVGWELTSVAPSPRALSLAVRRASAAQQERAMGFSPTAVEDPSGRKLTLGTQGSLFFEGGPALRLLEPVPRKLPMTVWAEAPVISYYVDWFDDCRELLGAA